MHYIVDGYNVIRKTPFLDHEKLKDAREALLRFIDTYHPQGSPTNKITVVFDAQNSNAHFSYKGEVAVVFSRNESADDCITSLVDQSRNARNVRVVSDDRELVLNCRSRGAEAVSVRDFIETPRKKMRASQKKAEGFFELPYSERIKINEELGKLWLK